MKVKFKIIPSLLVTSVLFGGSVSTASAAASNWQEADMARARLVSSQAGTEDQTEVILGVQVQLKEGWKTYWRSPGDSGLPPVFEWQDSDNLQSVTIEWPRPSSFDSFGIQSWGYKSEVVFPVRIKLKEAGKPLKTTLHFSYGVCEQVCVPLQQSLTLSLPAQGRTPTDFADLITDYQAKVPLSLADQKDVQGLRAEVTGEGQFQIVLDAAASYEGAALILEGEDGDFFEIARPVLTANGSEVTYQVAADLVDPAKPLKGRDIVVTVLGQTSSLEEKLTIK